MAHFGMPNVLGMVKVDGCVLCYHMQKKTHWVECKENLKPNSGYLLEGCKQVSETVTVDGVVRR